MPKAPDFERADEALEQALAALPLLAGADVTGELRREYSALVLYVLHTKERLALLHGMWSARGLPQAEEASPRAPAAGKASRAKKPKQAGTA